MATLGTASPSLSNLASQSAGSAKPAVTSGLGGLASQAPISAAQLQAWGVTDPSIAARAATNWSAGSATPAVTSGLGGLASQTSAARPPSPAPISAAQLQAWGVTNPSIAAGGAANLNASADQPPAYPMYMNPGSWSQDPALQAGAEQMDFGGNVSFTPQYTGYFQAQQMKQQDPAWYNYLMGNKPALDAYAQQFAGVGNLGSPASLDFSNIGPDAPAPGVDAEAGVAESGVGLSSQTSGVGLGTVGPSADQGGPFGAPAVTGVVGEGFNSSMGPGYGGLGPGISGLSGEAALSGYGVPAATPAETGFETGFEGAPAGGLGGTGGGGGGVGGGGVGDAGLGGAGVGPASSTASVGMTSGDPSAFGGPTGVGIGDAGLSGGVGDAGLGGLGGVGDAGGGGGGGGGGK